MPGPGVADARRVDRSSDSVQRSRTCAHDISSLSPRLSPRARRHARRRTARPAVAATGGTLIIAQRRRRRLQLFPPLVGDATGTARPGHGLRPPRRDRAGHERRSATRAFSRGSRRAGPGRRTRCRSRSRSTRARSGTTASRSRRRTSATRFRSFTDPKVGSPNAPLLANIDSVSGARLAHRGRLVQEAHAGAVLRRRLSADPGSASTSTARFRSSSCTRPTVTRTLVGSGQFRFVKWEPGVRIELIADTANYRGRAEARSRHHRRPSPTPTSADAGARPARRISCEASRSIRSKQLDSSKVARPLVFRASATRSSAINPFAPKSKTAPHPIFSRHARASRAGDGASIASAMLHERLRQRRASRARSVPDDASPSPTARSSCRRTTRPRRRRCSIPPAGASARTAFARRTAGRSAFAILVADDEPDRRQYAVLLQEQFRKLGVRSTSTNLDNTTFDAHAQRRRLRPAALVAGRPIRASSGIKQNWGTAGDRATRGRTSCATRTRRSTRCSTARRRRSIRPRSKRYARARLPDDHRRRPGDLALRHRARSTR